MSRIQVVGFHAVVSKIFENISQQEHIGLQIDVRVLTQGLNVEIHPHFLSVVVLIIIYVAIIQFTVERVFLRQCCNIKFVLRRNVVVWKHSFSLEKLNLHWRIFILELFLYNANLSSEDGMKRKESINLKLLMLPSTVFVKEMHFSLLSGIKFIVPLKVMVSSLINRCESYPLRL